jgi:hypothetical protein
MWMNRQFLQTVFLRTGRHVKVEGVIPFSQLFFFLLFVPFQSSPCGLIMAASFFFLPFSR